MMPSSMSDFTASNCSFAGTLRVDAMELPQRVLFDAEALQAAFCVGDEFFGAAVLAPDFRTAAREAAFGGDDEAVVRVQRFADEFFGDVRAVDSPRCR